jgi:hypothetical protein
MEINAFIQIDTVTELDLVSKPQTDAALNRGSAIHAQDQPVEQSPQSHTDNCGNPSKHEKQSLFKNISKERRRLATQIKMNTA